MGHTSPACAFTAPPTDQPTATAEPHTADTSDTIAQLFARLLDARCTRLSVNEYVIHEPVNHGDSIAYRYVHNAFRPLDTDLVELPVSYSDYGGSDLDAANVRALIETLREDTFVHLYGPHDSVGLALPYGRPLPDDPDNELLTLLVGMIESLIDYALIDESTHSDYVHELADEAWDSCLRQQVMWDLDDYAPDDDAINAVVECDDDTIRAAYYGYDDNEWFCETATSVVNYRHDDAVRHVARTIFGWDVD